MVAELPKDQPAMLTMPNGGGMGFRSAHVQSDKWCGANRLLFVLISCCLSPYRLALFQNGTRPAGFGSQFRTSVYVPFISPHGTVNAGLLQTLIGGNKSRAPES
jgi:hypothetical protein